MCVLRECAQSMRLYVCYALSWRQLWQWRPHHPPMRRVVIASVSLCSDEAADRKCQYIIVYVWTQMCWLRVVRVLFGSGFWRSFSTTLPTRSAVFSVSVCHLFIMHMCWVLNWVCGVREQRTSSTCLSLSTCASWNWGGVLYSTLHCDCDHHFWTVYTIHHRTICSSYIILFRRCTLKNMLSICTESELDNIPSC